jgi:hypothetical protein
MENLYEYRNKEGKKYPADLVKRALEHPMFKTLDRLDYLVGELAKEVEKKKKEQHNKNL